MLRVFKQYYPIRNIFFVVGEGIFIYSSVVIASWLILGTEEFVLSRWLLLKILLVTFVCQACLYYNDLYDFKITDSFKELGIRLLQALGIAAILLALVYILIPRAIIGQGIFAVSTAMFLALIVSWRLCYTAVLSRGLFNKKIILMGSGLLAANIVSEISETKDCGYELSLAIPENSDHADFAPQVTKTMLCDNNYEGLCQTAKEMGIQKIVVAMEEKRGKLPIRELLNCRVGGIDILEGNSFFEMLTGKLIVKEINPGWLIFSEGFQKSRLRRFFKRATDLMLSLLLLIFLMPLIVLVGILIKLDSRGPVIYSQERVGERRKIYRIHKFRSMVQDAEKLSGPVWAQDDDPRVTKIGNIMRKLRIDEIPQLWNVLKGEMSFAGPRPERDVFVKELEKEIPYYGERFSVKPGITGWAQVSYGYGASVEDAVEKLNYDLFYIKNMSTMMDLMIALRTIKIVIFSRGAR